MGALGPIMPWIPEDDFLLKNAVEAGASLESLAKGAVQFSQRYTITELQDRWYSLLYDPVISTESSTQMTEFDRSTSNLFSKCGRENSKGRKEGRKKRVSIRSCYYALRKRLRTEPLSHSDLNYLVPDRNCCGSGHDAPECNNILGDSMGNHFALTESNFDNLHHSLPQVNNIDGPFLECESGPPKQLESLPFVANNMCEAMPCILDSSMDLSTAVGTVDPSKELSMPNIFDGGIINPNPMSCGTSPMSPEFGGVQIFNSPISDCDTSFYHLQHLSPPSPLPDWIYIDGMGIGSGLGGKDQQTRDAYQIPNNGHVGAHGTFKYSAVLRENEFEDYVFCGGLKPSCDHIDLAELSDSILNFSEDDMLFMNEDGKDVDKSYIDELSLLLDSPADVYENQMVNTNVTEVEAPVAQQTNMVSSRSSGGGQLDDSAEYDFRNRTLTTNSDDHFASVAYIVYPQLPEYRNGVICCTLNTEDPEVPGNDDIILSSKFSSTPTHQRDSTKDNHPSSSFKGVSHKDPGESVSSPFSVELKGKSLTKGQETRFSDSVDQCRARSFVNCMWYLDHDMANQSTSIPRKEASDVGTLRESGPNPGCISGQISDGLNNQFQNSIDVIKQEGQDKVSAGQSAVHGQLGPGDSIGSELGEESLLSDPEEILSGDDDIPSYSDVESMILGMDLDPDDQESFVHREVAKYMEEAAQRTIIRLEQAANASVQRNTASRGAIAVLSSNHLNHYIKKAEVLLGRATEDIAVDIDLGREIRANKISRRQAAAFSTSILPEKILLEYFAAVLFLVNYE